MCHVRSFSTPMRVVSKKAALKQPVEGSGEPASTLWPTSIPAILSWVYIISFYMNFYVEPKVVMRAFANLYGGDIVKMLTFNTIIFINLTWFIPLTTFYFLYRARIPFIEQYKMQNWVWDKPAGAQQESYFQLCQRAVKKFIKDQLFMSGLVSIMFMLILGKKTEEELQQYVEDTPAWYVSFYKLMIGFAIFETNFYWGHRWLHTKEGYKYHKDHHAFYTPVANTGNWGHDLDGLLNIILPGIFPVYLLDMHLYTFWMWAIVHIFHSMYDHHGYAFPFDPLQLVPFSGYARAHNFHHSHNNGNYGLYWRFWDVLLGTDAAWKEYCNTHDMRKLCLEDVPAENENYSPDVYLNNKKGN